jgi:hypothetical protein
MEDDRGNFVVIAAGYRDQMGRFLESNPGLPSRFSKTITFDSYEVEDLLLIAESMATGADHALAPDAVEVLRKRLTDEKENGGFDAKSWANARTVRNVVDQSAGARDALIAAIGDTSVDSLMTLTVEDVTVACDDLNIGVKAVARETVDEVLAEFDSVTGQPPSRPRCAP